MDLLSVIRRWHLREGLSVREIARRTRLSRNTIKKYLGSGEVQPRYVRTVVSSKLDNHAGQLKTWLADAAQQGRKRRRTVRQMYRSLRQLGYTGSYDRVCAFARAWKREQQVARQSANRDAHVPLRFNPGDAFQFDWSEETVVIAGERTVLQVAHFKLSYSGAFVLRAYPLQTHEMLFDAHNHALAVLGGVARRGIYDNMKTAVDRIGRGKARVVNARFAALASHYLFKPEFCSPAAGWEKGQIEKDVQDARRRVWIDVPECPTLAALNDWLEQRCVALWSELKHPRQPSRTIAECWAEERPRLMALPGPFDGFVESTKRVSPTCLVHFDRNRYSVPATYAHRPVSLRVYADRIVVVADGAVIAEHSRVFDRRHDGGRTIYDWHHYLSVLQRKPGALRNGAPFDTLPGGFRQLQAVLMKHPGGDREMVDILALVLQYDEQAVLAAVELALESGAPSKPQVINLLVRLTEPSPPPPMTPPPALTQHTAPAVDIARYDALRESSHVA
ncbi:MAG TPA: IS21 family transposase [Nevskiaceae bacterium]|nr:IS21 family transposase [Nevskiaceae bacterium]